MNTGLREYAEWGAVYRSVGLAAVSKRLMREMFDCLPEEKARELGRRNGREEGPQMTIHWFGTFNVQNVLRAFGSVLARYSGTFVFEHTQEGRIHTVVIRHEMGRHASAYYAEYARTICELLQMKCSVSETDAQILIKAEEAVATLVETARGLPSVLTEEPSNL
jgi:hypothetical protein